MCPACGAKLRRSFEGAVAVGRSVRRSRLLFRIHVEIRSANTLAGVRDGMAGDSEVSEVRNRCRACLESGLQALTSRITFRLVDHVRLLPREELGETPSSRTAVTSRGPIHLPRKRIDILARGVDVHVLHFAGVDAIAGLGVDFRAAELNASGHARAPSSSGPVELREMLTWDCGRAGASEMRRAKGIGMAFG